LTDFAHIAGSFELSAVLAEDPGAMEELKKLVGRFITPTLVIGDEVLLGFGMNLARIVEIFGGGQNDGG